MDAVDTCPMDIMSLDFAPPETVVHATKGSDETLPDPRPIERKAEISAADVAAAMSRDPVEPEPATRAEIAKAEAIVSMPA